MLSYVYVKQEFARYCAHYNGLLFFFYTQFGYQTWMEMSVQFNVVANTVTQVRSTAQQTSRLEFETTLCSVMAFLK